MNTNMEIQYINLLKDILENGVSKKTRNGGTISVFGRHLRHDMKSGFPAITTKKLAWKSVVTELLWFLRGDTNIKYLVDNECYIWDGDCYKNYVNSDDVQLPKSKKDFIETIKTDKEFSDRFGDLGPIYGSHWRNFGEVEDEDGQIYNSGVDQISELIESLKNDPDSRRLLVSAWNPTKLSSSVLPPCHYGFQVYTRELSLKERMDHWFKNNKPNRDICDWVDSQSELAQHVYFNDANVPDRSISLMWNQRSVDTPLGLPFNIASYGLLLEIIGRMVNMVPDELIANLGDAHIYENQLDGIKEQLTREPYKLPTLNISDEVNFGGTIDDFLESCDKNSFKLNGYMSHPSIKIPLSN